MKFVPLQEFFPGTLRRPTLFFFMEGSASGILLEDARLSKLMVFSIPCIQRKSPRSVLVTTLTCATPENISSSTTVREQFAFFTTGLVDSHPWPSQVKWKATEMETEQPRFLDLFDEKITLGCACQRCLEKVPNILYIPNDGWMVTCHGQSKTSPKSNPRSVFFCFFCFFRTIPCQTL